jgi:hypothetical protein
MTHRNPTNSTRGRALTSVFAASALLALAPALATAQSESPDCVAIVAEMLAPTPSAGAIRASAGCPATGPVTLANRWTRLGARTAAERAALVEASAEMRDARLYDAVSNVVRDEAYGRSDRLAGLRVLPVYAEESGTGVMQQGHVYGARAAELSAGRQIGVPTSTTGSNALPATVRDDIARELSQLAREDRDPEVRRAARRAGEKLGYDLSSRGEGARSPMP